MIALQRLLSCCLEAARRISASGYSVRGGCVPLCVTDLEHDELRSIGPRPDGFSRAKGPRLQGGVSVGPVAKPSFLCIGFFVGESCCYGSENVLEIISYSQSVPGLIDVVGTSKSQDGCESQCYLCWSLPMRGRIPIDTVGASLICTVDVQSRVVRPRHCWLYDEGINSIQRDFQGYA